MCKGRVCREGRCVVGNWRPRDLMAGTGALRRVAQSSVRGEIKARCGSTHAALDRPSPRSRLFLLTPPSSSQHNNKRRFVWPTVPRRRRPILRARKIRSKKPTIFEPVIVYKRPVLNGHKLLERNIVALLF